MTNGHLAALIRGVEARAAGERLDSLSASVEHNVHCVHMLLKAAKTAPYFENLESGGRIFLGHC